MKPSITLLPQLAIENGSSGKSEEEFLGEWKAFVYKQQLLPGVQPIIARSWKRCWAKVNPFQPARSVHLNEDYLFSSQLVSFDLLSVALPILEDVQQNGENTSTAILFANTAGCVLNIYGDSDMVESLEACGVVKGAILTEELVGTNAVGLALAERMPVQVVGYEHYVQAFHQFGTAAAPMFDLTGHPLGVVGIFTLWEKYHPYALGLATVTAKAIEGQQQADVLMREQNSNLAELNAVLSAISEGILVWNSSNVLMHANLSASQLLGAPAKSLLGKPIDAFMNLQPSLDYLIRNRTAVTDREVRLTVEGHVVNTIMSIRYVYNGDELQWIIATLRPVKEVRQLVHHQIGASAALTLEDIPGNSPAMLHVRRLVRVAAPAKASILIHGEPGTGKNALASAIHNFSANRDGPFVIFACASIPNELVLPELLGYDENFLEKRTSSRPSKFELAEGGTLFLQDVDALPLEAQTILLNVLELGVVQRLGSSRPIKVDSRIIASTAVEMKKLIKQKSFRSDLLYRLSVFSITLPPLRDRPQDIPEVVDRILKRFSTQTGYKVSLEPGVIDVLKKYYWPGNVREIEAVIGRTVMQVGQDGVINVEDLPAYLRLTTSSNLPEDPDFQLSSLDEVEKETILRTVKLCRGNVSRMADILGVSRTTLWRRMKSLAIDPADYRHPVEAQIVL